MRPLLLLLLIPLCARGAEVTLAESLRLALERHPDVLAADAGLRLRLAEALAAEQRPAPRLEAELKDLGGEGGAEVRLLQPLRRGDLGLRAHYAAAERAALRAENRLRLLAVLNDTFQSHVALWAAQSEATLARAVEADQDALLGRAREAAATGLMTAAEVEVRAAAAEEARAAALAAEAARLEAAAAHARRLGAVTPPVAAAPDLAALPADPAPLVDFALGRSDLRQALAAREQAARRQRTVARSESDSPMEIGLLAEQRAEGESWAVGVGFALELPVPGRRRAAAAAADAELRAARAHPLIASPDVVAAEVRARHAAARVAAEAVGRHAEALRLRQRGAEASTLALAEGLVDLAAHAEALDRLAAARQRDLALRVESLRARSRLEEALGGRLEQALPQ